MTRDSDVNLGLRTRANVGRENSADILLSIHMNGHKSNKGGKEAAYGTITLVRPQPNQPNDNRQVNYDEDITLATRVVNTVLEVNPETNRHPSRYVADQVLGVLNDESLGNSATFHKTRACLLEVDFIDVPRVDRNFNEQDDEHQAEDDRRVGNHNSVERNRELIAEAIRDAIIDDLLHQP